MKYNVLTASLKLNDRGIHSMKFISILFLTLAAAVSVSAQNDQAPIQQKDIKYKNWAYKNVRDDKESDLRTLAKGKKLVIVVYYAPWCPDWRHDAPILQKLYDKYHSQGLEIVGVGEYDPISSMQNNLNFLKVTFPAVYESVERTDYQKTLHFEYRRSVGDNRKWGSPWYIFLDPSKFEKKGDVLVKQASIINGDIIEAEGEAFIREKLGLKFETAKPALALNKDKAEICDPKTATSIKPSKVK